MIMKEELKRDKLISVLEKMIREYSDLLDRLINLSLKRNREEKNIIYSFDSIHFEIKIKNVH